MEEIIQKLPLWSARAGNVQQFMFWEHNQSDTTKHGTIPDTGTLLLKVHIFWEGQKFFVLDYYLSDTTKHGTIPDTGNFYLKFIYSEKATKFCEFLTFLLS